jgi:CspA family cold shock protein
MSEGKVRWFNYQKGYGFIHSEEHEGDIFLHHSEFETEEYVHEGSTVIFDTEGGEKGLKAKNVTLK